jgi:hypothetical protein
LRIPDFLDLSQSAFLPEPVDERLNGGVSDALFFRQTVENLADRARSAFPVLLQNARLGF